MKTGLFVMGLVMGMPVAWAQLSGAEYLARKEAKSVRCVKALDAVTAQPRYFCEEDVWNPQTGVMTTQPKREINVQELGNRITGLDTQLKNIQAERDALQSYLTDLQALP